MSELRSDKVLAYAMQMADLQERLIRAAQRADAGLRDREESRWPARIDLSMDGEPWRMSKHGLGVCFESEHGTTVDIPRFDPDEPRMLSAWTLTYFIDSLNDPTFTGRFDAEQLARVGDLLDGLSRRHSVENVAPDPAADRLFRIPRSEQGMRPGIGH